MSEAPERPEAYDILLQLRRFNLNWNEGGYDNQPWLLYQELNAVHEAEEEHSSIKMMNLRRRQEFEASRNKGGNNG